MRQQSFLSACRVHVVFGLVISGFEVIKKIEGLKTDSASRPYADVRVMDCGQLITKSANDGKLCHGFIATQTLELSLSLSVCDVWFSVKARLQPIVHYVCIICVLYMFKLFIFALLGSWTYRSLFFPEFKKAEAEIT